MAAPPLLGSTSRIYMRARLVCVRHIPLAASSCSNLDRVVAHCPGSAPSTCTHSWADRMRRHHGVLLLLLVAVLLLAATSDAIRPAPGDVKPVHTQGEATTASHNPKKAGFLQEEVRATGSSLPDCTHACGACSPCSRVMVSFKCSISEPCPMVYRCMCKGRCYPVPSS